MKARIKNAIQFRGFETCSGIWRYGFLLENDTKCYIIQCIKGEIVKWIVDPATVGQYTGIVDKNGNRIYVGDVVEFYELGTFCINPDCEPHLIGYGSCLKKEVHEVEFSYGVFGVDGNYDFVQLSYCGISEEYLEEIQRMEQEEVYFDTCGYEIDDSIVGIKVIGNIYDNKIIKKEL